MRRESYENKNINLDVKSNIDILERIQKKKIIKLSGMFSGSNLHKSPD